MSRRRRERRRNSGDLITRPRSSPANLLVLTVIGVLVVSAAAAAFMGSSFEDVTPHGQLLSELQSVAQAQERHYMRHGAFAEWINSLEIEGANPEVRVTLLRGDVRGWEAVAHHGIGLTCMQSGRIHNAVPRSDPPTCFTTEP